MTEPIHVISLGAGVQSSTMALMAARGEITPMPKCAIFADTQAEPKSVYVWLDWLEKQLPFPVVRVSKGNLRQHLVRVVKTKRCSNATSSSLPAFILNPDGTQGILGRGCTQDFKIRMISKEITRVIKETGVRHCAQWIGISVDEVSRVKDSRRKAVTNRYPLIDLRMSRNDCLRWMERKGFPNPPRSACTFCPYHNNAEWRALSKEDFKDAVNFELELQAALNGTMMIGKPYLHRSMVPLDRVDLSTEEERGQLNMFNNECEGMCGV